MADVNKFVQAQNFSLAGSGCVIGATTVTLKSFAGIDGTLLTMTDFGSIGFATLEPGNGELEEQICFTGVTQNANGTATLTGVSNVLFIAPYTQTSGVLKTHAGSTTLVISNTSGFYDALSGKNNDETITGLWTFPDADATRARITSDTDTAVATAFVTLGQLSRQAISGASNASTTVKGIVELATQAELLARTTAGATGALLVPTPDIIASTLLSDYKADTGAANAYAIAPTPSITAYTAGQIFSFKATSANTTTSTLAVSGLTTKTIKRMDGTNLLANDIKASQIVVVEYDGTNFIMISPTGNNIDFTGTGTYPAADGSAITKIKIFESLTAGATINGATLPVPVYIDATTNKIFACDANVGTALEFIGFATTNSTDTNPIVVQFQGVVAGFTGLTAGAKYYVQDAVGTIGTSIGTGEVYVGIAISTTQVLIDRGTNAADQYIGTQALVEGANTITAAYQSAWRKVVINANFNATPVTRGDITLFKVGKASGAVYSMSGTDIIGLDIQVSGTTITLTDASLAGTSSGTAYYYR